jgi:cobalt-zinc-cadmium resistance protein CzcA
MIQFRAQLQSDSNYLPSLSELNRLQLTPIDTQNHPILNYYQDVITLSNREQSLQKQKLLPDLNVSLFRGSNDGVGNRTYSGMQFGLAIPLWFGSQRAKIRAAKTSVFIMESKAENFQIQLLSRYQSLQSDLRKHQAELDYYHGTGKKLAEEIEQHAKGAYKSGEIDYLQYIQLIENARTIKVNYLKALKNYNMKVLEANYLMN